MSTPVRPGRLEVVQKGRCFSNAVAAFVLGLAIGAALTKLYLPEIQAVEVDFRLETACRFPQGEGQFLAVTILNGKLTCWRYY